MNETNLDLLIQIQTDWDLLTQINEVVDNQFEICDLIINSDFTDKPNSLEVIIDLFLITQDNIKKNRQAAIRICEMEELINNNVNSLSTRFRMNLIKEILNESQLES